MRVICSSLPNFCLYVHIRILLFAAITKALADWKAKKEASLHGEAEGMGQPQEEVEEEEEENIYAVAPEPDVRTQTVSNIYAVALALATLQHAYKGITNIYIPPPN